MPSRQQKTAFSLLALLVATAVTYLYIRLPSPEPIAAQLEEKTLVAASEETNSSSEPPELSTAEHKANAAEKTSTAANKTEAIRPPKVPGLAADAGVFAIETALSLPSDPEFYRLVELLKQDPDYFDEMVQELMRETDALRLKWLAYLLAETRDARLTHIAAQMLSAGRIESSIAALTLLRRTQQHSEAARQLVLQTISHQTEAPLLVAAINALSRVGTNASTKHRQQVASHLLPLLTHQEASVRRASYSTLLRWSNGSVDIAPQLAAGLSDPDAKVRRSTAFGLIRNPHLDQATKLALFSMLNDTEEPLRNRKAAAMALIRFGLNSDENAHVEALTHSFNRKRKSAP